MLTKYMNKKIKNIKPVVIPVTPKDTCEFKFTLPNATPAITFCMEGSTVTIKKYK